MEKLKLNRLKVIYIIYILLQLVAIFLLYEKYGLNGEFISYSLLIIFLSIIGIIDIKKMIIPNKFIIIGFFISLIMMILNNEISIISKILGGIISGGVIWSISYLTRGGIGLGDVKLVAVLGLFVGLVNIFNILLVSTIFSGFMGIIVLIFKIKDKKDSLPFAPFILLGTTIVLLIK